MLVSDGSFNPLLLHMALAVAISKVISDGEIGAYNVDESQEILIQPPTVGMCTFTLTITNKIIPVTVA